MGFCDNNNGLILKTVIFLISLFLSISICQMEEILVKSIEELELTKNEAIIDPKSCNDFNNISVFIHSAAEVSGSYFDKRQATRETWVSDLKKRDISVYFVLGLNTDQTTNEELIKESDKHQDIIQFAFIDSYYNLTLKAISILRWIDKNCKNSAYIMKTDDDVMVNTDLLLSSLSEFKTGFNGVLYVNLKPHRDSRHKHFMPRVFYPEKNYPDFMAGNGYIMAGDIIGSLLTAIDSYTKPTLFIDDLLITGLIAEVAGIERHSTDLVDWGQCHDICQMHYLAINLECIDPNEVRIFWTEFKNSSAENCPSSADFITSSLAGISTLILIICFYNLKF